MTVYCTVSRSVQCVQCLLSSTVQCVKSLVLYSVNSVYSVQRTDRVLQIRHGVDGHAHDGDGHKHWEGEVEERGEGEADLDHGVDERNPSNFKHLSEVEGDKCECEVTQTC